MATEANWARKWSGMQLVRSPSRWRHGVHQGWLQYANPPRAMATTVRPGSPTRLQAREDHLRWQPFIRHGTVYKLMEKPMIQIDRGTNTSEFLWVKLANTTGKYLRNIARAKWTRKWNSRSVQSEEAHQRRWQTRWRPTVTLARCTHVLSGICNKPWRKCKNGWSKFIQQQRPHSRQNVGSRERGIRNDDRNSKEVASASLTTGWEN